MGQIILNSAIVRKKGFLYYIDKEGNIRETESIHLKRQRLKDEQKQKGEGA